MLLKQCTFAPRIQKGDGVHRINCPRMGWWRLQIKL